MDALLKQSREVQVVLGGAVVYVILSFLNWQQVCVGSPEINVCGGVSEWHGIGVLGGLFGLALLGWEVARLFDVKLELGSLTPGVISLALAAGLLVLTVITFLSHSAFRHWPEWVALLISIVIAVAAFRRAQNEGVEVPGMSATTAGGGDANRTAEPASAAPADSSSTEPPGTPAAPDS
jgi:hypothetical protein